MEEVLISVIMPVYNCAPYIEQAVNSILNQTLTSFEFLIIDDASTDKTAEIIQRIEDSRIKLIIKQKNSGYTNSLNMALSLAKGKYIARMDGDDFSYPERFTSQVDFLEKNEDISIVGSSFCIMNSNKRVSHPTSSEECKVRLLHSTVLGHPTVMLRRQFLSDFNLQYDASKESTEDYDLWVRASAVGNISNVPEVLLDYRVHESQVSVLRKQLQSDIADQVRLQYAKVHFNDLIQGKESLYLKFVTNAITDFESYLLCKELAAQLIEHNARHRNFNGEYFELFIQELVGAVAAKFYVKCIDKRMFVLFHALNDRQFYHSISFQRKVLFLLKIIKRSVLS